jgi:hypothetical protein
VIPEQRDPSPLLRLLAAPLRGRGIGRQHGPLERCAQLPGGLVLRPGQDAALDRPGEPGVQRAGVLADQLRPVQVDRALAQGRQGGGKPVGQAHRQVHPVLGTALGQRQGQRNLVRGEPGLQLGHGVGFGFADVRDRAAVPSIRGPVAVLSAGLHRPGDTAATGELGHRGEFLRLGPRGHLAPGGDRGHLPHQEFPWPHGHGNHPYTKIISSYPDIFRQHRGRVLNKVSQLNEAGQERL